MTPTKYALVTGGAHRLGKHLAIALAKEGYSILLHYFSSDEDAKETTRTISALDRDVIPVKADLSSDSGIKQIYNVLDALNQDPENKLSVVVNSAAIMPRINLQSISGIDWDQVMAINLRAPFLITQKAAEYMGPGGLVINISDTGAIKAWTQYAAYVVSKSALESLTRIMAKEYAPDIRVNAIAPGLVLQSDSVSDEEWVRLVNKTLAKRATPPEDIVAALTFLLNNQSITGQTLVVDGGFSLS